MKKRLLALTEKFAGKNIAVVGDISLDTYFFGEATRINPEKHGAPLIKIIRKEHRLGMAANVAANVAALGASVHLYGVIGDDLPGSTVRTLASEHSLPFTHVFEGETLVKERTIEETHSHYVGRNDFGEAHLSPFSENAQSTLLTALASNRPDAIILSDYNKRAFTHHFAHRIISYAERQNILTVVDPKPENLESFTSATLLSPNLEATERMTGLHRPHYRKLAETLRSKTRSKYVVVTLGNEGMLAYDGQTFQQIPTHAREVVDVVGAGDTVKAALALSLAADASIGEASHIANYAAGVVVERPGTAAVSLNELVERIRED